MRPVHTRVVLLIASLSACADAAQDEGTRIAREDQIDAALALLDAPWCEPFAQRFCAAATTCSCAAATGWPSDCLVAARAQCRRDLRRAAEGLADGFLVSRDGVPRCLELIDEAFERCDRPDAARFATECRLVVPRIGETFPRAGERCPRGLCARGLRCASDQVCRVPHPRGDRCLTDGDCVSPLLCRSDCSVDRTCPAVCIDRPASSTGDSCSPETGGFCGESSICLLSSRRECAQAQIGSCSSDLDCPSGEVCGIKGTLTCTPLPGLGEFCGDRFQCRAGLACDVRSFQCAPAPGRGEPCMGLEFGLEQCNQGLVCRNGACGSPGQEGETCRFGTNDCVAGLGCEFDVTGIPVCQPLRGVDDRCQSDIICGPDNFCDFTTLTCRARVGEGSRCDEGSRCLGAMQCVEAEPGELRCQEVERAGDPCAVQCPAGLACRPVAQQSRCVHLMCSLLRL